MDRSIVFSAYFIAASRWQSAPDSAAGRILARIARHGFRPTLDQLRRGSQARRHAAALLRRRRAEILREW